VRCSINLRWWGSRQVVYRIASVYFLLGTVFASKQAMADGALIWTPVKVAPRVYQTTLGSGGLTRTLALNQPVAPDLDFTASVVDPLSTTRTGDVQMHYQIKW
jgi:hypothetical protein